MAENKMAAPSFPESNEARRFVMQCASILVIVAVSSSLRSAVSDGCSAAEGLRLLIVFVLVISRVHSVMNFYSIERKVEIITAGEGRFDLTKLLGVDLPKNAFTTWRWFLQLLEYYAELANVIVPAIAGLLFRDELVFYVCAAASWWTDSFISTVFLSCSSGAGHKPVTDRERCWYWLLNSTVITVCAIAICRLRCSGWISTEMTGSSLLLAVAVFMDWHDYYYNRDFYFGMQIADTCRHAWHRKRLRWLAET